ncbi:DUF6934 family protein [Parasediminibacterium sp. JCM 36343]|uniref:DUF6934 family protein n=1 Tax=Parasediminibacterium sp. JCM 36343 TaxID=3374279 RepID=UPI00397D9A17
MKLDKYPVIVGEASMVFEFISEGINGRVSKLVIYSETHLHNFYNLGFGDKHETTGEIDDEVVTNNGDSEKVLATVAATLYTFTDKFPNAMVFAAGSTKARTRLYRIGISNNIATISEDFEVFGLVGENTWLHFQKQMDFEAFLVKRKKK